MSELAMAVVLGPAVKYTGYPKYAHVVGHLYVGGAGLWQFDNLDRYPERRVPPIRMVSNADVTDEIAAGFALAADIEGARDLATERLGKAWASHDDLEIPPDVLQEIGGLVRGWDVCCLVTELGGGFDTEAFASLGWSLIVAVPQHTDVHGRWG